LRFNFHRELSREHPFRHPQEAYDSVASYIRDRAGARGHRVCGLRAAGLDEPADFLPFSVLFARIGYFCIVVVLIANVIEFGIEELQRKLKERNQALEQTVEKGTIALQPQEEELKRASEIQQMLLPSKPRSLLELRLPEHGSLRAKSAGTTST
jgi:hypothetical protein